MGKDRHGHHAEHLQKGENAGADVVIAVQIVIDGAIELGPPDDDEQKGKTAQASPTDMGRKGMGQLGDDDHIDQVIKQFQKSDLARGRPFAGFSGGLPPIAKSNSML